MRSRRMISTVESHTEGMPTRVVVGGVPALPGSTMEERRQYLIGSLDELRTMLMYEPRGHSAMSGAVLQPPLRPDADWGVVYIEVSGALPMCGHGTIGVATVLVETGMVEVVEPVTTVRLDAPAGLVEVDVRVEAGRAVSATLRNVPSFAVELDRSVDVAGFGQVTLDLAYGGNFYAILPAERLGLEVSRENVRELIAAGTSVIRAVDEQCQPVHPLEPTVRGCRHAALLAADATAKRSPHAMVIHPGWIDRSPCGTGTSARMAQLSARGELDIGDEYLSVSIIGSEFAGRIESRTSVGDIPAIVPTVTGRAWITGTAQWFVDPDDPFAHGFRL
jgi:proline racemase